jgi:hypothetical protein
VSSGTATKITVATAAEVCQNLKLGDEARSLLRDGLTPPRYLDALLKEQHFIDAVNFLAHALPKREAVWWACQCARLAASSSAPPVTEALRAAEQWAADPSEGNRRKAKTAADAAQLSTPAGCAALGAFLSGGSLAPPEIETPVPPGEHLTARIVAGAIQLAAVMPPPDKAPERFREFLALGQDVAAGINRWQ